MRSERRPLLVCTAFVCRIVKMVGETMQTLQKFHAQLFSPLRQASYSPLLRCLSGFILVLGATYLTAQNMCFPFPCCTTCSPSYRRWLSSICMMHGHHNSLLNPVSLKCLRASSHLPVMAPCFFSPLYPLTSHTSEHRFKDLFCPPYATINWAMIGPC